MKNPVQRLLGVEEATKALGVSRQTLYAYTSRGLVRATVDPADSRRSLYNSGDIGVLKERKRRGRSRDAVAASTIDFGDPVLQSSITQIVDGKLLFRGQDAVELSRRASLEDVAALLWQSTSVPMMTEDSSNDCPGNSRSGSPAQRCIEAVAGMATAGAWSISPERALPDAYRILRQVARAAVGRAGVTPTVLKDGRWHESGFARRRPPNRRACQPPEVREEATLGAVGMTPGAVQPVHELLATSWGKPHAAGLIRQALVLCADHELNASTYAARVIASTRATLGAAVLGGLCALSGPLHGGATDLVRSFLSDQSIWSDPDAVLAARIARGERFPGFGHRLYPTGDPRAAELLEALHLTARYRRVVEAAVSVTGTWANIDFALVLLEKQLKLPRGAAFSIFATGRVVGWIAHALEQWSDGRLIRPRASYVGPR